MKLFDNNLRVSAREGAWMDTAPEKDKCTIKHDQARLRTVKLFRHDEQDGREKTRRRMKGFCIEKAEESVEWEEQDFGIFWRHGRIKVENCRKPAQMGARIGLRLRVGSPRERGRTRVVLAEWKEWTEAAQGAATGVFHDGILICARTERLEHTSWKTRNRRPVITRFFEDFLFFATQ